MPSLSTQPLYKSMAANRQPVALPATVAAVPPLGEAVLVLRLGVACSLAPREWRLVCNAAQTLYGRHGAINTAVVSGLPLAWWVVWSDAIPCRDDWLWLHAAYVALEPLLWRRAQAGLPSLQNVLRGLPAPSLAAVADAFRQERLYTPPEMLAALPAPRTAFAFV
jgi:hypothetical protein